MEISDENSLEGGPRTDKPAAILRGSARGLEIVVEAPSGLDAITAAITTRLAEAPSFFKGSDVRIRVEDGPLPVGSLAKLEDIAQTFELRIVEIGAAKATGSSRRAPKATDTDAVPQPAVPLAIGSGGFDDVPTAQGGAYTTKEEFEDVPTQMLPSPPNGVVMATAMVLAPALGTTALADALASARTGLAWASPPVGEKPQPTLPLGDMTMKKPAESVSIPADKPAPTPSADQLELALKDREPETRIVVGPVRSGVILDHRGHVIVFGDVNPGAEVRATGNIVVLGRLRGLAHAGIAVGGDKTETGFIIALHLQPQQLRIGRMVARASDDAAAAIPEIAYVTNGSIVVERYNGRLPAGLAASLS